MALARAAHCFSRRERLTSLLCGGEIRGRDGWHAGLEKYMSKRQPGIKKVSPGKYRIRVTQTCPRTGKRKEVDRIVSCETLGQATECRIEFLHELAKNDEGPILRPTVRDYATSWLERRKGRLKPATVIRHAEHLDRALPWIGDIYMDSLLPNHINECLLKLAEKYSGNTLKNLLLVLRTMTRDAQADLDLPRWPCARVKPPKPVNHYTDEEPNLLSAEELQRVLVELPKRWKALATIMAWTGLRFGEATALRWEDVDTDKGLIRVRRSQYRSIVSPATKTGKVRTVPLVPELAATLLEHRHMMMKEQHPGLEAGWVFPSDTGGLMHTGQLRGPLKEAAKRAGVKHRITPHGLRRTFNNLVRQVEADAVVIRSITGHSTEQMREHYSHVGVEEKQRAQQRVIAMTRSNVGLKVGIPVNENDLSLKN
jgi:integrase